MSEETPDEGRSSSGSDAAATQSRSIFSYFSNGNSTAGPSRPPPPPAGPKKRRKKDDDLIAQSRLLASGESGWMLDKYGEAPVTPGEQAALIAAAETSGVAPKKAGTRIKDEGEAAEMKEMKKRAREAAAAERKAKRQSLQVSKEEASASIVNGGVVPGAVKSRRKKVHDSSTLPPDTEPPTEDPLSQISLPTPPTTKRARGRRRRSAASQKQEASQSADQPLDLSQSHSSDPPDDAPPILVHRASSPSEIVVTGHFKSDKVSHPFFSRTNSAMSTSTKGASQHDPIDIDVEQMAPSAETKSKMPRKTLFASDLKPAHSFFSKVAASEASGTRASSVVSETAPTDVSATTTKSAKEKGKAKVHGFFKGNGHSAIPGTLKEGWGRGIKEAEGWLAPWPGRLLPSHEPWTMTVSEHNSLKRRKLIQPFSNALEDFWSNDKIESFRSDMPDHRTPSPTLRPIPTSPLIERHPAIISTLARPPSDGREIWTEHYRPRRACEVLGNEIQATYLRDWLSALAVGSKDGTYPKVVRKIKKYKAQSYDGWIVDDIGLFGSEAVEEEEEELDFIEIEYAPLPFHDRPSAYPDFRGRLANAILLIGPSGSGKSAAVHAVTTELGWDVFEVYPGIGKRTAANLFSLVGDVGKNHMVVKSKEEPRQPRSSGKNFFGAVRTSPRKAKPLGSQEQPIDLDDHAEEEIVGEESKFRQSVILLDEVDLLFDEENTFWGAVRSLIAESKRPVILTCNDPETVPLATLPLQAILDFRPPPIPLAASYLAAAAKTESVTQVDVPSLVAQCMTSGPGLLDHPLPPNGHEPMPTFDLRKALMQLQLDRNVERSIQPESDHTAPQLESWVKRLEARSFSDAMVAPRSWALMEEHEIDRHDECEDDQLDIRLLCKPEMADWRPIIPAYDQSKHISAYLEQLSGGRIPSGTISHVQTRVIRSLLPVLDPLIPLSAHLLPHASLFLDHLPIIRSMVRADNMMEEAEEAIIAEGGERINRKTGRPMRAGKDGAFKRYLDLDRAACHIAIASELVF